MGYFLHYCSSKSPRCNLCVQRQAIKNVWRNFQTRNQNSLPACTTIMRLVENFNNLQNVEIRTGWERLIVFEQIGKKVNSYFRQHQTRSPRSAVTNLRILNSPIKNIMRARSHDSIPSFKWTSVITTRLCWTNGLSQSCMEIMLAIFVLYVRSFSLKNMSFTSPTCQHFELLYTRHINPKKDPTVRSTLQKSNSLVCFAR